VSAKCSGTHCVINLISKQFKHFEHLALQFEDVIDIELQVFSVRDCIANTHKPLVY
jgi:hypothetical protein